MATNNPHSVHALVRLLKSSTDPPTTPGPSKIEIARLAWSDPSFRAANKGEVIGEWILTLLGHAKKTRLENDANLIFDPIADSRYWTLLCAVLTTPSPTTARSMKTWLLPLLNRFQVDSVVIQLLTLRSSQVLAPARVALAALWPLVEKRIGVDALAECLSAVFNACAEWNSVDDNMNWICSAVVTAYRKALENAGNKKKHYNFFLTTHLSSWLRAICTSPSIISPSSTKQLQDRIYTAGTDTLFSLDALKQSPDTLFDALSTSISSLFPILPKLCTSFLSATHRHRSTLFVSGTSVVGGREEVQERGMEFVGRCWVLIRGSASSQENLDVERWRSVIGVLRVVEKERLFVAHPIHGMQTDTSRSEYKGALALSQARDKAIETLEAVDTPKDHREERVVLAIQLLDVLVQIEYDFVGSILERVFFALISIPPPQSHVVTVASSEFLIRVLEYHTKTRSVHTYALTLLRAVAMCSASPPPWMFTSQSVASTFPITYHLPALTRSLRTSLTPTQTTPLATAVIQAFESAWTALKGADAEEERFTKKRKVTENNGCKTRLVPIEARVFSFTSRVAGTILSNLPANAYIKDEEYSLGHLCGDVGKLGWTVVWDCLEKKTREGDDTMQDRDRKKRKQAAESGSLSKPYCHTVASAALRFLYDLRARVSFSLGDCDQLEETRVATLLNVVQDEASDPELVLEIIRTFFWHVWYTHYCESKKHIETHPIFTVTLDILNTHPPSKSKWSGKSVDLSRDNLGLAVIYILTERWIDILDLLASTEHLERLILLLISVSSDLFNEDTQDHLAEIDLQRDREVITLHGILLSLLRNAQFWELHNIRALFLSSVLNLTAPLSSSCFPTAGVGSSSPMTTIPHNELRRACNIYSLLLYVPPEYFTRFVRTELVKRAMAGDVQICRTLQDTKVQRSKTKRKDRDRSDAGHRGESRTEESDDRVPAGELKKWTRRLASIRIFLQRIGQFLGTGSHTTSLTFVNHLLSPPSLSTPSKALTDATLDLIQLYTVNILRSKEPEAAASVSIVISAFTSARPFSHSKSQETWAQLLIQSSILRLIERTTSDFDPASVSDQVKHALEMLFGALESALSPLAKCLVENDSRMPDQFLSNDQINAWSRMLSLRRWLGINHQHTTVLFGLKLATSVICSENPARLASQTCSSVLGLLFEELWCVCNATHRAVHLDALVGFYAASGGERGSDIEHIMNVHVTHASKKMPVEDFSHLLAVLEDGIGGSGLRVGHRERLIHLGQVMLHDSPQGTLKAVQHFATRSFNLFADREEIYGGSSQLKLQCLEFIAGHCSDRPAAIRSVDLGSIWSLLNKVLSGSLEHDATTVFPIFHHIVTITGALIRLRRDLVVHTLPHLSLVLRQLMMLIRKIRPQLGAKQSRIVTDTFPSWLSASQPLSTDEARALARLLTSLTTKTVPRTYTYTSAKSQKAESLAKPFAKHASYVLVAYVDAFNDPLCIINAEMRKDLEPGLFALCEMVGEHSRDALMLSALDSGGKTIMKSLWREYEKQRYTGKG